MLNFITATPEEAGVPSSSILRFLNRLEQYHIPMHSIQIMRNDRLITQGYYAPCSPDKLHRMFSVSKSLTSLAICKLEEEGRLHLDDPIIQYFPEYVPEDVHPWIARMTIRHMLMMRTCHASTTYKHDMNRDWVESFFITPPTHKPGTVFHYDTSASHTLCALAEKLTGRPMLDYLKEVLLDELGFSKESYMLADPFGHSLGGSGLMALPEDLLRLGYLLMHKGNINGKQLISTAYLEEALSNQTSTAVTGPVMSESQGYGYQYWRGEHDSFVCYGMGGQLIICLPKENLLCVTTADTQGIGGGNQLIYNCFYEELLPSLSAAPLPEDKVSYQLLQETLAHLSITPLCHIYPVSDIQTTQSAAAVNGKEYVILENPSGFERLSLNLGGDGGTLLYTLAGSRCQLPFGYDRVVSCSFPGYDMECCSSGMWLDGNTFYIKVHLLDTSVGSVHFQLVFGDEDVTVFLRKNEESLFHEYTGHLYGIFAEARHS